MILGANFLYRNIPEPGTLGLLAAGFAAWAIRRKPRLSR